MKQEKFSIKNIPPKVMQSNPCFEIAKALTRERLKTLDVALRRKKFKKLFELAEYEDLEKGMYYALIPYNKEKVFIVESSLSFSKLKELISEIDDYDIKNRIIIKHIPWDSAFILK